jgi:hypothetical protein
MRTEGCVFMSQEEDHSRRDAYEGKFVKLSEAVEKRLLRAVVILFVLLVLSQGLLCLDFVRQRITGVDRLEGRSSSFAPPTERVIY